MGQQGFGMNGDSSVTDDLAFDQIDDVFGDVCRMVSHSFYLSCWSCCRKK